MIITNLDWHIENERNNEKCGNYWDDDFDDVDQKEIDRIDLKNINEEMSYFDYKVIRIDEGFQIKRYGDVVGDCMFWSMKEVYKTWKTMLEEGEY